MKRDLEGNPMCTCGNTLEEPIRGIVPVPGLLTMSYRACSDDDEVQVRCSCGLAWKLRREVWNL
jgi:hypothetical protein